MIKEHLVIVSDLVKAAIAGNQKEALAAEAKWYKNADEIIDFLTRINPFIDKDLFKKMFYHHLELTKQEAVSMISKEYKNSVDLYEILEKEALMMADVLTKALVKQFPAMFI